MFIEYVRIEQGDKAVEFDRMMDSALETTEDRVYQYAFGTYKENEGESHISSGCKLDFEIVTPEPRISVEVSDQEVYDENTEYATWTFTSPREFENWAEENDIRLV